MRLSRYFLPTMKEIPNDAQIDSHRLMLRAGMIRQASSGIYCWMPLGLKVLARIEQIVREEMDRAGALEILMPTIQSADLWRESGRYDDYGREMLRIVDRHGRDMLFGPTNEEQVTQIFRENIKSYKDLPLNLYHIQWKFRDEIRPRFGVMRGREFLMKDAYSFDVDYAAGERAYQRMFVAYLRIFARLGLKAIPMRADTGPIGGKLSHEFIVLADTGESAVFFDRAYQAFESPTEETLDDSDLKEIVERWTSLYAATEEMHDPAECPIGDADLVSGRGIEVGHIFFFGDKYSSPMKALVQGPDGGQVPVQMGSYGVGVSRLVGALIEACHDESGICWPERLTPFDVGLINLRADDDACADACEEIYAALQMSGRDVLYDDTKERAGAKFARMDLVGLPWQVMVGPRGIKDGIVELKNRRTGDREEISRDSALSRLTEAAH